MAASYHWIVVPIAVSSATVAAEQKLWAASPVGEDGQKSSSKIVIIPDESKIEAFAGSDKFTKNCSVGSFRESSIIGIKIVVTVTPGRKVSVPELII